MTKPIQFAGGIVACVAISVTVWFWFAGSPASSGRAEPIGAPVRVAQAQLHDAPTYISSVGTVQAFNTVTVRPRVEGEINHVMYREGGIVKRGDVLVQLDRRPYEAQLRVAVAQKDKDQTQLENVRVDLARYENLAKTGFAPKQTIDTTRATIHQLEATIRADEAQIDVFRLQLEYATILSPIDGRVGARLVDVGNMVHPADASGLVVVTQIHPVTVSYSLPQSILPKLRTELSHHPLRVIALAQDGSSALDEGELTLIDNQIDTSTGTIRCKATFTNAKEALWPGQFVTARTLLNTQTNVVVLPTSAIQTSADGSFVYVIKDGVAKIRKVDIGQQNDGQTVVARGVAAGESVVVEGQFQLEDNARVSVK